MPVDLRKTLKQAWKVVTLDEAEMKKVAKDKKAMPAALTVIGLFSIAAAFGFMLFPPTIIFEIAFYKPDLFTTILHVVTTFIMFTASFFIVGYLAEHVFNSKLDMRGYVKVLGFGQLVGVVMIELLLFSAFCCCFFFPELAWQSMGSMCCRLPNCRRWLLPLALVR